MRDRDLRRIRGQNAGIQKEMSQASGKARARYPHSPLGPSMSNGQAGKMKRPAYTPGTSPSGS